jgi:lycopene beta-cyclase
MHLPDHVQLDYILIGGGLQNALIILALAARQPDAHILLLEQDSQLAGNHIWSWQAFDLPSETLSWARPLIEYEWPGYQLYFQNSSRWVAGPYRSLSSEHLAHLLQQASQQHPNIHLYTNIHVVHSTEKEVTLSDGQRISGRLIIDSRGPKQMIMPPGGGYQKFVGLECRLKQPTTITDPILMDTRCQQRDGFRFFYILPFAPDRVLIEDTYFSNDPSLDPDALHTGILNEAQRMGFVVQEVIRTEIGVLPMPTRNVFHPSASTLLQGGYAGGWFNPGTGYSFAAAIRLADYLAATPIDRLFGAEWQQLVKSIQKQAIFLSFLNTMMFGFFHGVWRRKLMERFYLLPDAVIHRFFAMQITLLDQWRIMWVGAPWTPKRRLRHAQNKTDCQ